MGRSLPAPLSAPLVLNGGGARPARPGPAQPGPPRSLRDDGGIKAAVIGAGLSPWKPAAI